ncbi:hypothetical protein [Staphylococcus pettenkoferi]|uniref:Uncharacterized protein n=1 Tax=Staphylococcus pettenkoferi TaxID=170573 RepID=A0ABT4BHQ8_9STAP|nr:hypothetical protein [Staphylococcus pettenkoferi]MCI2803746.1 hypothetical protein [Staphylococcus pettenkoferi]MCY1563634.1 hypothetical protein [Staphylococcus pettenkoferi]MCY1571665.1 hypothetical protein [Staphylococcus pettenkoferi]MCY1582206.1 hypothetical protein [Staphylococcus pettenkoferi]MCY1606402.1 hypothetical protein [Staphylococcus pettenkoferi]
MKLVSKVLGSTILTGAVLFTGMQAGRANAEEEHYSQVTKDNAPEIIKYYAGENKRISTSDKGDYIEASAINSNTTATHYRLYKDGTLSVSNNGAGAPPFQKIAQFPLKNNQ